MTEIHIKIEDIPLVDLLGVENIHIKEIAQAFPQSRITSRGDEIILHGQAPDLQKIGGILQSLIAHFHKHGEITTQNVQDFLFEETEGYDNLTGDVILHGTRGNSIKPKTPNQARLVNAILENDLVFALGPAGTGKTYLSVAMAVRALKNKEVKKIILTRPAVEAGENLGFLPGDLKEKIDPYIRPIYDALEDMIPAEKLKFYQENNIIEIAPLAFMRGRTLSNAYILLDEAQNTTPMQLKMCLTRLGKNSKMIITGDTSQIDLPQKQKSGLIDAMHILRGIDGIAFIELSAKDVSRHTLVKHIINAYETHGQKPIFDENKR
ncbi:MAG: PhoH family protein [Cytophagales bacterium]|nr:PhoH family protein [Cytophagales bacterium]